MFVVEMGDVVIASEVAGSIAQRRRMSAQKPLASEAVRKRGAAELALLVFRSS